VILRMKVFTFNPSFVSLLGQARLLQNTVVGRYTRKFRCIQTEWLCLASAVIRGRAPAGADTGFG
jgi:hypothetical protein